SNDYRVVLFGAGGVGKSSLVLRFIKGTFRESYVPTIEDTYRQIVTCDKNVCTLQITDTTGSHQFPAMQRLSITRGDAFILVYSVTTRQSIEELTPIYQQVSGRYVIVASLVIAFYFYYRLSATRVAVPEQTRIELSPITTFPHQIREIKRDLQHVPIFLVGNKCDEEEKKIHSKEGSDLAQLWGCGFIETSAKTSYNVHELFQKLL
uniref:Small monomeric GTPase n=1 Tax=Ciona savignyi TaxID=51511 RepID=H2YV87_CIOSA